MTVVVTAARRACLAACLVAGAAWAQTPAGPPPRPAAVDPLPAGWRALHQQAGWQAALAGQTVVIVEEGFTHLRGLDGAGRPVWRTRYQDAPRGIQQLFVIDGQPLMYGGERLTRLDPRTGTVESQRPVPFLAGSFSREHGGGPWLNDAHGACALSGDCSFQLVDCRSGAPVGPRYDFQRLCRYSHRAGGGLGPKSCGCWGKGGALLGRSGDVLVAALQGLRRTGPNDLPGDVALGVHARTGKEVWRVRTDREPASYVDGAGVTPSGRTCWLADAFGALTALDCASGRKLWAVNPPGAEPPHRPDSWITGLREPAAIFHFDGDKATLYAERAGKALWSVATKGAAFAAVRGHLPTGYVATRGTGKPGALLLLHPRTGAVATRIDVPDKGASFFDAGDGRTLVLVDRDLRLHDAHGSVLARARLPFAAKLTVGDRLVAAAGTEGLVALDRATLKERGRLRGWYEVRAVEGALGARRVLCERLGDTLHHDATRPRQILLLEMASGGE
jgi:outer membrane protein assembly factor BamB